MSFIGRSTRILQLFAIFYITIGAVYTADRFVLGPLRLNMQGLPLSWLDFFSGSGYASRGSNTTSEEIDHRQHPLDLLKSTQRFISWDPSSHEANRISASSTKEPPILVSEDLFLSKAFSQSMHPSKIVPFFYRAAGDFDREDITITTLVTSNRFKVFAELVENYQGPISVTIHVKSDPAEVDTLLTSLHELYTSSLVMSTYVDVHLVIDPFDRQFNTWRNIARLFARTDFVMMLDVDFAVCTNFRRSIRESKAVINKLREGSSAFVIPAFEYLKFKEGMDQSTFPKDKKSLVSLISARRIGMFHRSWAPGHNSTDYDRFYSARPGEVYKVTSYQAAYEPYIVFKKDGPPWCDERFVGYGGNKAACIFEMHLSGIDFYVLSDHFIVHQNHMYEEVARKQERKHNRKLYADFKEETCLRYLKLHHDEGTLNSTRGHNVVDECKRIRGISRAAALLVEGAL